MYLVKIANISNTRTKRRFMYIDAWTVLAPFHWLDAKSETVDSDTTFRPGYNILGFAKYFASGSGEDNAGSKMTGASTSGHKNIHLCALLIL